MATEHSYSIIPHSKRWLPTIGASELSALAGRAFDPRQALLKHLWKNKYMQNYRKIFSGDGIYSPLKEQETESILDLLFHGEDEFIQGSIAQEGKRIDEYMKKQEQEKRIMLETIAEGVEKMDEILQREDFTGLDIDKIRRCVIGTIVEEDILKLFKEQFPQYEEAHKPDEGYKITMKLKGGEKIRLLGRVDAIIHGNVVIEIKNRQKIRDVGPPQYDIDQLYAYMLLTESPRGILVEHCNGKLKVSFYSWEEENPLGDIFQSITLLHNLERIRMAHKHFYGQNIKYIANENSEYIVNIWRSIVDN